MEFLVIYKIWDGESYSLPRSMIIAKTRFASWLAENGRRVLVDNVSVYCDCEIQTWDGLNDAIAQTQDDIKSLKRRIHRQSNAIVGV